MSSYEGVEYYKSILEKVTSSLKWSLWRRIGRSLNIVVDILAIATPIFIFLLSPQSEYIPALVCVITLGLLAFMFVCMLLLEEYRLSYKARYAEIMKSLHLCIHIIRDIHFYLQNTKISDEDRCEELSFALWALARCFSLLKGVHCRACIKLICIDDSDMKKDVSSLDKEERLRLLYVKTFCRDLETIKTKDFKEDGNAKSHTVGGNTDFRELYLMENGAERYWCCNNIHSMRNYQNTRFAQINDCRELKYRSTLVVPIRKTTKGVTHDKQIAHNQDILGFVCIDSMTRGIFDIRYDPELLAAFADALFILMKDWFKKPEQLPSQDKKEEEKNESIKQAQ